MLERLAVINLPSGSEPYLPYTHPSHDEKSFFVLKTCLRTLIIDFQYPSFRLSSNTFSPPTSLCQEVYFGKEAYIFILEVLCGLRSKLLAESEIVGQFRLGLAAYLESPQRQNLLIKILEKLLKDAKEIRRSYLTGITQKSYAALARKLILKKGKASHVLLIGSGKLCLDIIHQLKKWVPLTLTARNATKVEELAQKYSLATVPWQNIGRFQEFSHIICSVGTEDTLFDSNFFEGWVASTNGPRMFLNFGPTSLISTEMEQSQGVFRLDDLFKEEKGHEMQRKDQIYMAHLAIRQLVEHRKKYLPTITPSDQGRIFAT